MGTNILHRPQGHGLLHHPIVLVRVHLFLRQPTHTFINKLMRNNTISNPHFTKVVVVIKAKLLTLSISTTTTTTCSDTHRCCLITSSFSCNIFLLCSAVYPLNISTLTTRPFSLMAVVLSSLKRSRDVLVLESYISARALARFSA